MVTQCDIPPAQFLYEKPDKALARPGVYCLFCDISGKYYVGSSINIGRRIQQHSLELRKGRHYSPKVMGTYRKYGEGHILARALEFNDGNQTDLLGAEKWWIINLDAVHSGMNISEEPCGNRGIKRTSETRQKLSMAFRKANLTNGRGAVFKFISPSGEICEGENISDFCRSLGMNKSDANSMSKVMNGDAISHKGWRAVGGRGKKQREDKPFCLMPPPNTPIRGRGIKHFCEYNGLDYAAISALLRGGHKESSGWTCPEVTPVKPRTRKVPTVRRMISPNGDVVEIKNIAEFCRHNGLCSAAVYQVLVGHRPHHKGWRKSPCM